jgi:hypothetical protein
MAAKEGLGKLFDYDAPLSMQVSLINIFGYPVKIFTPLPHKMTGYENRKGVDGRDTGYEFEDVLTAQGFLDFNPKRRVFYHFNYFPDDEDKVVMGYFNTDNRIKEGCFVKTLDSSPVAGLYYKISRVIDDGLYKALKRTCFLMPMLDRSVIEAMDGVDG